MRRTHALVGSSACLVAFIVAVLCIHTGCQSPLDSWDSGESSYSPDPPEEGTIADFANDCANRAVQDQSCFLLLDDNEEDLRWRLALIDSAKVSLDLKTFIFARDFSGRLLMSRMLAAADRGVRVRLLIDDFAFRGRDREIAVLDQHPNVNIRLWNPGTQRRLGRNLEYLVRLRELNHRLHNKVIIADNLAAITGGRNTADAYFGLSEHYNFFDLDLLATGPVVAPTSGMFDRYWNSPQAIPGANFYRNADYSNIPAERERLQQTLENSSLSDIVDIAPQDWSAFFDERKGTSIPGLSEVIYDKPGDAEPSQHTLIALGQFVRRADREVLSLNPYLVPGEAFFNAARELEARGVDMAIMTNSLGSTNQPIVHGAYSQTRLPMLRAGVDVYEMKYQGGMQSELDTPPIESNFVSLHAKAAVVDRRYTFIGSFNFSPRSRNLNTEMGIFVNSEELGEQVAEVMERSMHKDNAWRLRENESGELRWESEVGKLVTQPSQSFWRRVQNGFFGLFPLEEHL